MSVVLLLGEPKKWESALQVLVDLLRTNGKPNKAPPAVSSGDNYSEQLPVIACNMDLQFMERACMPRFVSLFSLSHEKAYFLSVLFGGKAPFLRLHEMAYSADFLA